MTKHQAIDEIAVRRSDPVYNAHGYLTKVPVSAIMPLIERYTAPGDVVLDVFAGSGMTGVAAAMTGRRAVLVDISELGRHVGTNYVRLVDGPELSCRAEAVVRASGEEVGDVYVVPCVGCGGGAELSRTIWTFVYECPKCSEPIQYYDAIAAGERAATCPQCSGAFEKRGARKLGETPVLDVVSCTCSRRLREQPATLVTPRQPNGIRWPDVPIAADREMYRRSALGKHGTTSTASFFSQRNLTALASLHQRIVAIEEDDIREKLLFAFTAILPRASKRYQWGPKRPLNAQNQTYYVAPVFLEWNVFDLYLRKIQAIRRSDTEIRRTAGHHTRAIDVQYHSRSADDLSFLDNDSIDYVFTDPPFGSNIFYSDMNLFQEVWLGTTTDREREAVIPTNGDRAEAEKRYEALLTDALTECRRVLKPGGALSLVFSNSSGTVWAIAQRAISASGLELDPDGLILLDKGQRSVKGLASGYERVVTTDLIITLRKTSTLASRSTQPTETVDDAVRQVLPNLGEASTPSRLYLELVRRFIGRHWDVAGLNFGSVLAAAGRAGLNVDRRTGRFAVHGEMHRR